MDQNFWDTLNQGITTLSTGAEDYLQFQKTQQLNNILTNPNTQAGQIYTTGQAQIQTGAVTSSINLSYLIIGGLFLVVLFYIL